MRSLSFATQYFEKFTNLCQEKSRKQQKRYRLTCRCNRILTFSSILSIAVAVAVTFAVAVAVAVAAAVAIAVSVSVSLSVPVAVAVAVAVAVVVAVAVAVAARYDSIYLNLSIYLAHPS